MFDLTKEKGRRLTLDFRIRAAFVLKIIALSGALTGKRTKENR